jgi:hypothetical protein
MTWSPNYPLPFRICNENFVYISHLYHSYNTSCQVRDEGPKLKKRMW